MEEKLDEKLYGNYLKGEKEAFEVLYNKYKGKIQYFIYNIVKDYQKSEDLTQETFIYVMQNKMKENYNFKYYIYLVAKSKAYNYINVENRRNEIIKTYLSNEDEQSEKDILEIITREENKKELMEAIESLDEKYRNALYLVNIEGFSYKETAQILGENIQNTKNIIHRGKSKLRKILLKKELNQINKFAKIALMIVVIAIVASGVTYAVTYLYKKYNTNHNIKINPTFESTLDENTINNLWIGTLDLAWKDLEEKIGTNKIEFEENIEIANKLNQSTFSKEMLDSNDYNINVERTWTNGYKIDAKLNKELNFLEPFDNLSNYPWKFGNSSERLKWFGINNATLESVNKNIEVLFYDKVSEHNLKSENFAVKLKTKEGDEIILYRTDEEKSFEEYYNDILEKSSNYIGRREFGEDDELRVPYVRVNGEICYNELYGKEIKNSKGLIMYDVTQNVNFYLNEKGCNLSSKASMVTEYMSCGDTLFCYFQNTFIIFMKEANSDKPYFALKVDKDDILEKYEETDEPKLNDYTMMKDKDFYKVEPGEYKFYEDENYEYYYPTQKTKYVVVYFKNGDRMTVEEALAQGKITIDLLDKYEYEYIKKKK